MVERAIIPHAAGSEELKDNVSIINATDLKPLVSVAENVKVHFFNTEIGVANCLSEFHSNH